MEGTRLNTVPGRARLLLRENLALALSVAATFVVALRLLAAADLNVETALAILQNLGPGNVLLATVLGFLPVLISVGLAACVALMLRPRFEGRRAYAWASAVLAGLSFFVVPWQFLAALATAMSVDGLQSIAAHRWGRRTRRARAAQMFGAALDAVAGLAIVYVFLAIQPWLAPEVVNVGGHDTVAYVLKSDAQGAVLLSEADRHVLYLTHPLRAREVCMRTTGPFDGLPLYKLVFGAHSYPTCPGR